MHFCKRTLCLSPSRAESLWQVPTTANSRDLTTASTATVLLDAKDLCAIVCLSVSLGIDLLCMSCGVEHKADMG